MAVKTVEDAVVNPVKNHATSASSKNWAWQTTRILNDVVALANDILTNSVGDGVIQDGTLAVSATTHQFKTTTELVFRKGMIQRNLAATDNLTFASAYTINTAAGTGDFWGAFLAEATNAATPVVSAKASAANQVYTTEAAAVAALPAVTAGSTVIGYITVQANSDTDWVANTDDLVAASDCQDVNFYDTTALAVTETAADTLTFRRQGTP